MADAGEKKAPRRVKPRIVSSNAATQPSSSSVSVSSVSGLDRSNAPALTPSTPSSALPTSQPLPTPIEEHPRKEGQGDPLFDSISGKPAAPHSREDTAKAATSIVPSQNGSAAMEHPAGESASMTTLSPPEGPKPALMRLPKKSQKKTVSVPVIYIPDPTPSAEEVPEESAELDEEAKQKALAKEMDSVGDTVIINVQRVLRDNNLWMDPWEERRNREAEKLAVGGRRPEAPSSLSQLMAIADQDRLRNHIMDMERRYTHAEMDAGSETSTDLDKDSSEGEAKDGEEEGDEDTYDVNDKFIDDEEAERRQELRQLRRKYRRRIKGYFISQGDFEVYETEPQKKKKPEKEEKMLKSPKRTGSKGETLPMKKKKAPVAESGGGEGKKKKMAPERVDEALPLSEELERSRLLTSFEKVAANGKRKKKEREGEGKDGEKRKKMKISKESSAKDKDEKPKKMKRIALWEEEETDGEAEPSKKVGNAEKGEKAGLKAKKKKKGEEEKGTKSGKKLAIVEKAIKGPTKEQKRPKGAQGKTKIKTEPHPKQRKEEPKKKKKADATAEKGEKTARKEALELEKEEEGGGYETEDEGEGEERETKEKDRTVPCSPTTSAETASPPGTPPAFETPSSGKAASKKAAAPPKASSPLSSPSAALPPAPSSSASAKGAAAPSPSSPSPEGCIGASASLWPVASYREAASRMISASFDASSPQPLAEAVLHFLEVLDGHRLSPSQKDDILMKLGPKIRGINWTALMQRGRRIKSIERERQREREREEKEHEEEEEQKEKEREKERKREKEVGAERQTVDGTATKERKRRKLLKSEETATEKGAIKREQDGELEEDATSEEDEETVEKKKGENEADEVEKKDGEAKKAKKGRAIVGKKREPKATTASGSAGKEKGAKEGKKKVKKKSEVASPLDFSDPEEDPSASIPSVAPFEEESMTKSAEEVADIIKKLSTAQEKSGEEEEEEEEEAKKLPRMTFIARFTDIANKTFGMDTIWDKKEKGYKPLQDFAERAAAAALPSIGTKEKESLVGTLYRVATNRARALRAVKARENLKKEAREAVEKEMREKGEKEEKGKEKEGQSAKKRRKETEGEGEVKETAKERKEGGGNGAATETEGEATDSDG